MRSLLLLFVLYATSIQAQISFGTLKVEVSDENGESILGANVGVYSGDNFIKGASSDPYGLATIAGLEPGEYTVKVSYIGYATYLESIDIKANSIKTVLCKLEPSTEELNEVVIRTGRTYIETEYYGGTASYSPRHAPSKSRSARVTSRTKGTKEEPEAKTDKTPAMPAVAAGVLTAGELNDFNKFDLWSDLSKSELSQYKSLWHMNFDKRYAVVLKNADDGAVIQAKVSLLDNDSNKVLWTSVTNNAGRCELWLHPFTDCQVPENLKIRIDYNGQTFETQHPVNYAKGINQIVLPVACSLPNTIDIAFVVDATGSMGDEINYLKSELLDVLEYSKSEILNASIRTAAVFYKDTGDDYLVRTSDFSEAIETSLEFIKTQHHGGGGDTPEAVDTALLAAVNGLAWRENTRNKLLFLVLDAPPHNDEVSKKNMQRAIRNAATKGIRIIPVVCSGSDKSNEYLMRSAALATNGTYVFLTDHSGVGASHTKPSTDAYEVTYLNDLLKEIIIRFCVAQSCPNDMALYTNLQKSLIDFVTINDSLVFNYDETTPEIIALDLRVSANSETIGLMHSKPFSGLFAGKLADIEISPNPTSGILHITSSNKVQRVLLLDGGGQMLRDYTAFGNKFSIDVSEYANGIYYIAFATDNENVITKKFVLQK